MSDDYLIVSSFKKLTFSIDIIIKNRKQNELAVKGEAQDAGESRCQACAL